jgi:hypothetical protein
MRRRLRSVRTDFSPPLSRASRQRVEAALERWPPDTCSFEYQDYVNGYLYWHDRLGYSAKRLSCNPEGDY